MKKRKFKTSIIAWLVLIICLAGMVYSGYHIFNWKKSVSDNAKIKDELSDDINVSDDNYEIDFDSLKKKNSDTIAYLKVNGTNIDYIVVKGKDNSYYLNHNFNKEYNIAGWVFANYVNEFDGTDKNITIFGHDTKDGSMFGSLNNVLKREWQENKDNLNILLITEKGLYKYEVFPTYLVKTEDYYINNSFANDKEYMDFIDKIKSRSNYDYNVEANFNDSILTLSGCFGDGSKRTVLHARMIDDKSD